MALQSTGQRGVRYAIGCTLTWPNSQLERRLFQSRGGQYRKINTVDRVWWANATENRHRALSFNKEDHYCRVHLLGRECSSVCGRGQIYGVLTVINR